MGTMGEYWTKARLLVNLVLDGKEIREGGEGEKDEPTSGIDPEGLLSGILGEVVEVIV